MTVNLDGSPQVSMIWPGVEGDEIVVGHLRFHQKLRNVERDSRVVLSVEGPGRNALGLGDFAVAALRLDRALELEPDNAESLQARAKLDLSQGNLTTALNHLDLSIKLRPYEPAVHYSRKMVLTRLGRGDEAVAEQHAIDRLKADLDGMETLQAQLVKSPKNVALQYQLAHWMFAHRYDAEGVKWAQKILIDHPLHRATCALLAEYFERQGDLTLAGRYRAKSR